MNKTVWSLIITLVLTGCAGSGSPYGASSRAGVTGMTDENGVEYVTNGDAFADGKIAESRLDGTQTTPGSGPAIDPKVSLATRIRQYEFSRWDKAKEDPSRFGDDHWELKVFFRKAPTIVFTGTFGPTKDGKVGLIVAHAPARYTLTIATIHDVHLPYEKTFLDAKLTDTKRSDAITISYKGYLGKLDVREDQSRKPAPGSALECQLKTLRENTFVWVNNWTTLPNGRVFYLNDVVRTTDPKAAGETCLPPRISFRGESLATSSEKIAEDGQVEDKLYEHPVESSLGEDVRLIGNPKQGNRRMFVVPLEDKQTAQTSDVIVTVTAQDPADQAASVADDAAAKTPAPRRDRTQTPAQTPAPTTPRKTRPPAAPVIRDGTDAFIPNSGGAQAAREIRDFARNRSLPGVVARMAELNSSASLQNFFNNANPFVPMVQAISRAYDVVGWIYVTARESSYFKGNGYKPNIRGDWNKKSKRWDAWGPFQLHDGAASEGGITNGERDYFAPAACAAAQYVAKQVRKYPNDATIAILGYNQGAGGAGAAIYCTYHSNNKSKQQACNNRVNNGMSGDEYSRYSKLAQNYNYTYAEMSGFDVLSDNMTDYVNDTLATYFIANSLRSNGFTLANAKRSLPTNNTVMPPGGQMSNQTCQAAIAGTY